MVRDGKRKLEEILKREEYQQYYEENKSSGSKIMEKIIEYLEELITKLFPNLEMSTDISGKIMVFVIVLIVVLLAVIFFRFINKRITQRAYDRSVPLEQLHEKDWTYKDHFEKAERREKTRDFQGAIRHLFIGLILYYDSIDWIKAEIWKTNWEYYAELKRKSTKDAKSLNQLARIFDEVTYGEKEVSPEEYEEFKIMIESSYREGKRGKGDDKEGVTIDEGNISK